MKDSPARGAVIGAVIALLAIGCALAGAAAGGWWWIGAVGWALAGLFFAAVVGVCAQRAETKS